jgi:hypothetical protein
VLRWRKNRGLDELRHAPIMPRTLIVWSIRYVTAQMQ